ncbi:MAG: SLC13 family permease [Halobacteriota archaeon]
MIAIITLFLVFILIAIRGIGNIRFQIWQIMLFGALTVLITGQISPLDALQAINFDVILFLFGMFAVGQALEESGYLAQISHTLFGKAKSADHLVLSILFGFGMLSALLMNDTMAIIGTPIVLLLAKEHRIASKPLLLALAFAITIGSVMSPIGNPQNLLVAIALKNPFITFFKYLALPTFINLFLTFLLLKFFYRDDFTRKNLTFNSPEVVKDRKLASLCKVSLSVIIILIIAKIALVFLSAGVVDFRLTYIALIGALPVLVSEKRARIIHNLDWHTLIFFVALFVLMHSVGDSGLFQALMIDLNLNITSIPVILAISVLLSQLISNVPLVALYLPLLIHAGASTREMMALAAGSTIAGNMLILGAASNVIIIQNAEKKGETLTFFEFAKVGILLMLINTLVYYLTFQVEPG